MSEFQKLKHQEKAAEPSARPTKQQKPTTGNDAP